MWSHESKFGIMGLKATMAPRFPAGPPDCPERSEVSAPAKEAKPQEVSRCSFSSTMRIVRHRCCGSTNTSKVDTDRHRNADVQIGQRILRQQGTLPRRQVGRVSGQVLQLLLSDYQRAWVDQTN